MTQSAALAPRLAPLPRTNVLGIEVPVAITARARLLGLAFLDRDQAGRGLWIPCCRSVHTLGMRFELRLVFVAADGSVVRHVDRVGPRRVVACRSASGVLELSG